MNDRDYNSPEYDRPNYETAEEYNRARREREAKMTEAGNNPYGTDYSYNRSTYSASGMMTDSTGKPLKNYFALKLTLSIMMIMGCCCSNFFLVIVGIIALVFTCMANTAYNQGNAQEFQKKSKIATILLWIGGVVTAVLLMFGIVVLGIANQDIKETTGKSLWELFGEELWDDFANPEYEEPEVSYEEYEDRTMSLPDCFNDFSCNGIKCEVPLTYEALRDAGFELDDFSRLDEIRPGDLEGYSLMWDDWYCGYVCFTNYGNETLKVVDSRMSSMSFYKEQDISADLVFFGSVTWDSSYEDIEKLLGKPQYLYTEEYETMGTYKHYTWSFSEEGNSQGVNASFVNGELYEITIEWFDK